MGVGVASPSVVDLGEAVRVFQQLVPPETLNARQPPSSSTVYTPWIVAWLMVYQRLSGYGTTAAAVAELGRLDADLLPDNKRTREQTLSANTGGYSRGRERLDWEVARSAADAVTAALVAESAPSLGDRRVFAVDGSTLSLAPSNALRSVYPPARNQHGESHWPMLRLVTAHELSSGAALRPEIGAQTVGEVELAAGLMARLPAGSVLIGDRNFGVFGLAWSARQAGHDFVLRLTEKRFRSLVKGAQPIGEASGVWELSWRPSRWDRAANPTLPDEATLSVRLYEVRVSDELTLWLVSGLGDPGEVLAELYRGRQNIETDLRDLKQTLRLEELRARSAGVVRKELAAATIAYNLVVLIRRLAAARVRVEPRRLSFSRVWALVKVLLLESLAASDPAKTQERIDQVLRMAGQCKLPRRPGRRYPREVIPRRRKFPERPPKSETKPRK
jgi:hypothetical protein